MELTGKCKEEFEKWADIQDWRDEWDLSDFYDMSISMKYGVYVDYFDSVGIEMIINVYHGDCFPFRVQYWNEGSKWTLAGIKNKFEDREEARTAAIEKANEIRNEQLNK